MQEKRFLSVSEVAELMGRSKSYASAYVRQLNEELEKQGYLTIKGRVASTYFYKRFFGGDNEDSSSGEAKKKYGRILR